MGTWSDDAVAVDEIWQREPHELAADEHDVISRMIELIDRGQVRCVDRVDDDWSVNLVAKKALDLYFRTSGPNVQSVVGPLHFRDRFPLKGDLEGAGIRVAPPAAARFGSFVGAGATLVSCYVHLGAWVGSGTLVDSWAVLGTCSQVGRRVKILPTASIIGSLYPIESRPTIIEDDCQVGSGCIVGAGVLLRRGAILAPGVTITSTTPLLDIREGDVRDLGSEVPEGAIVIAGSVPVPSMEVPGLTVDAALVVGLRDAELTANENLAAVSRRIGLAS